LKGYSKPLALTYGIADYPFMLSKNISGYIKEVTAFIFFVCIIFNKLGVITIYNKAYVLAVMLFGIDKTIFFIAASQMNMIYF
jgi:hypothetical protein